MARGLTAGQKAQLALRVRAPAYFVELALSGGTIRVWNGKGSTTVLSNSWQGVGEHGIIEGIEQDRSLKSTSLTLALVGVPGTYITSGIVASTRGVRYQGSAITVYLGFCDTDTGIPLADPTAIWTGFADVMTFSLGQSITCSLTAEHFTSHLARTNGLTMTTESHNIRLGNPSPQDLFFEATNRLMNVARPVVQ